MNGGLGTDSSAQSPTCSPILTIDQMMGLKVLTIRKIFHVILGRRLGARTRIALKRSLVLAPSALNEMVGTY